MKAKIFITIPVFCSIFITLRLQAQEYEYIPLVNEEHVWSYCDVWRVGYDEYSLFYSHFQMKGDTIIHGVSYKKVYNDCSANPTNYEAAIREENKKVYVVRSNEQQEKLTYDFSWEIGDCILIDDNCYWEISKIDMVEIDGKLRKRFDNYIIEGIGVLNNNFFLYPFDPVPLYEVGICFNYQKKGSEIVYQTDEWYFNENECQWNGIQPPLSSMDYVIQIQENDIHIRFFTQETVQISLSDISGKLYYHAPSLSTIDVAIPSQSFPRGIYVLKIFNSAKNQANIRKIILYP